MPIQLSTAGELPPGQDKIIKDNVRFQIPPAQVLDGIPREGLRQVVVIALYADGYALYGSGNGKMVQRMLAAGPEILEALSSEEEPEPAQKREYPKGGKEPPASRIKVK